MLKSLIHSNLHHKKLLGPLEFIFTNDTFDNPISIPYCKQGILNSREKACEENM